MQLEWAKIYIAQNRPFFTHLGAQKLIVRELLKYDFRPEFDGILQYFFLHNFILNIFMLTSLKRKSHRKLQASFNLKVVLAIQAQKFVGRFPYF